MGNLGCAQLVADSGTNTRILASPKSLLRFRIVSQLPD